MIPTLRRIQSKAIVFSIFVIVMSCPARFADAGAENFSEPSSTRDELSEIDALRAPATNSAEKSDEVHREHDRIPSSTSASLDGSADLLNNWRHLIIFFAPGLITAAAIGVSGSVLGTFVLLRREALLALAMPQVVAAGAALGLRLGWPTLPPAMLAASAALLYLALARRREGNIRRADNAMIPALYISGLSISFLIIAGGGAHVEELQNIFTGSMSQ